MASFHGSIERTFLRALDAGEGTVRVRLVLGAPVGNKARQDYIAPGWLDASPLWQKRLFLAALFGAELTTPATIPRHGTVFGQPILSMNKRPANVTSGKKFLGQVSAWLNQFGVVTYALLSDRGSG